MAQEFCSLEQAAQMLGISAQELNQMAQRREVRAFADRGTWRFRIGDIQELARRLGTPSDPEMPAKRDEPFQLGADQEEQAIEAEVLLTPAEEEHEITAQLAGEEHGDIFAEPPRKGSSRGSGMGSSDSGIILVPKGSDVELLPTPDELGPASSSFVFPTKKGGAGAPAAPRAQSQLPGDDEDDSIVPLGREQPLGPGDSQVRLDSLSGRLPDSGVRLVDFDLPSQLSGILPPPSSRKMEKPGSTINLERPLTGPKSGKVPTPSSYAPTAQFDIEAQLAEPDLPMSPPSSKKGPSSKKMKKPKSSEFDLTPMANVPGDSVFELSNPSMPSLELELTSDIDSGSSSGDALDLEHQLLRPETGGTSRRRKKEPPPEILAEESAGTFELKMDSDEFTSMPAAKARPESSEFDLSLEGDASSSDFELSLDDDATAPISTGPKTARVPREAIAAAAEETSDFELSLDEDSSSEVVDETDSEVIVIEDDDTGIQPDVVEDEEIVEEVAEAEEETEIVPKGAAAAAAAPAEWGWWSMALLPTVLIMPFVGLLLFEMMRTIWSYQQPHTVTGPIYELIKSVTK